MRIVIVVAICVFAFSGCQKILEHYLPRPNTAAAACRVKSFSYYYYEDFFRTTINYDNRGNPVKITYYDDYLPDGEASEFLVYDAQNRLIRHEPYVYYGSTRTYVYEGNSPVPLRDTARDLYGFTFLETFAYDYKNRIIQEDIRLIYVPEEFEEEAQYYKPETHRYYYDARGNRQVNPYDHPWHPPIIYTDKPSIYSLHKAWQLIYRDHSRNSVPNVKTYHASGLPLTYKLRENIYWQPFLDLPYTGTVVYECP